MHKIIIPLFLCVMVSTYVVCQTRNLTDLLIRDELMQGDTKVIKDRTKYFKIKTMTKWKYEIDQYDGKDSCSVAKKNILSRFDQQGNKIEELEYSSESGDISNHWLMKYDSLERITIATCKDEQSQSILFETKQLFLYDTKGNVQISEYKYGDTVGTRRKKTFKCDKFGDIIEENDFKWEVKYDEKGFLVDSTGIEEKTRMHRWSKVTIDFKYDGYGKLVESSRKTFDDYSDYPALAFLSVYDSNGLVGEVKEYSRYSDKIAKITTFKYSKDGMLIESRTFKPSKYPIECLKYDYEYY